MQQEAVWLEQTVENIKNSLSLESGETSDYIKGKQFAFEVALCHNDVLSGNVLLHSQPESQSQSQSEQQQQQQQQPEQQQQTSEGNETIFHKISQNETESELQITLIDYEYSCYSYRAFDIANHFCGKLLFLSLFFYEMINMLIIIS